MRHAASPAQRRWRIHAKPARSRPGSSAARPGSSAARPGSSAARPGRQRFEQLPYWILICGTGLGLLSMRQGEQNARGGTLEIAGVLLVAAVARLMLPERRAGMLGSRRRLVDVAAFAVLGVGLLVVGLILPVSA